MLERSVSRSKPQPYPAPEEIPRLFVEGNHVHLTESVLSARRWHPHDPRIGLRKWVMLHGVQGHAGQPTLFVPRITMPEKWRMEFIGKKTHLVFTAGHGLVVRQPQRENDALPGVGECVAVIECYHSPYPFTSRQCSNRPAGALSSGSGLSAPAN